MKAREVPTGPVCTARAKDLGLWSEYCTLREGYKREGLSRREAIERAYKELGMKDQWEDYKKRDAQKVIMGAEVPLTPREMKKIKPNYRPPVVTRGGGIGEKILSLPDQIRWVKQHLARMRNGEDEPAEFPNADTLYWWQTAFTRPKDFDAIVMKTEAPGKDSDDAMMKDGEYQFAEIEKQIASARDEALRDGAQGPSLEPVVSA